MGFFEFLGQSLSNASSRSQNIIPFQFSKQKSRFNNKITITTPENNTNNNRATDNTKQKHQHNELNLMHQVHVF